MRIVISFILCNISLMCNAQYSNFNITAGIGISGINQLIQNNVEFYGKLKFNQKINVLDNKFRNNTLHSVFIGATKKISRGILQGNEINLSFNIYSFGSTYFKEDKFDVSLGVNDTINTPNWIVSRYNPSYLEIGLAKPIKLGKQVVLTPGIFLAYLVELYGTSKLTLWDSTYAQEESHIFYFNKEDPNNEYDQINYGLKFSISLLPDKILQPVFIYTQSLNDLSKENFYVNQHANLWSLQVGLRLSFKSNKNKGENKSI